MDQLINRFCPRTEFDSYEDFSANFRIETPEDFNFAYDVVDKWARLEPDKKALVWCDDHGAEKVLTFSDVRELSNRVANAWAKLGIKKGSVVMFVLRRRWEYWVGAVALAKLGAIIIPASMMLTTKDIVYRCQSAGVEMVVCVDDDYVIEQMEAALPDCPTVKSRVIVAGERDGWLNFDDLIAEESDQFSRPGGDERTHVDDTMILYFTSGTTGPPKMVRHNFAHPLGHIITARYWQQVQENTLHLSLSDSGWAKFGWGKIYGQWICGATVFAYDMDKFVPATVLQKIQDYKLTTFCAPPTMYRFMLQEDVGSYDLSSVQKWLTAGEPLNPEVTKQWLDFTGHRIREGFGQTESVVLVATWPWLEPKPGSMGMPSPLYNMQLLSDEDGHVCEDGEEGMICVTGLKEAWPPGLFRGYYHDDARTAEVFQGDHYNTGDVAWRDSDGYLFFVGRNDDVIKASGYRIGPFEVESALIEHPAVVECAVTGAPDPIRGIVVKASCILAKGWEPSDALVKELQDHVKNVTAPYKYPRIIEFVTELPKTISGKIKRAQIREEDGVEE
jgi:acetyl-CoA synthetase